jgi:hypothetical protein
MKVKYFLVLLFLCAGFAAYPQCSVTISKTDVSCNGGNNGSATATASEDGAPNHCVTPPSSPYTCSSGCTSTVSDNSNNLTVTSGQQVCLTTTGFTHSITMDGGILVICGTASPSNFLFKSGTLIINGTGTFSNNLTLKDNICTLTNYGTLNISGGMNVDGNFNNHGTCNITSGNLNDLSSDGMITNTGTLNVQSGNFNNNHTFTNSGNFTISETWNNNAQSVTTNNCSITAATINIGATITNNGTIAASGEFKLTSGTVNLQPGSEIICGSLQMNTGALVASGSSCSSVKVSGNASISTSAAVSGNVSICVTGTASGQSVSQLNCSCNVNTPVCTYSWKNSSNQEVGTAATVSNLAAGTYTLTTICTGCSSPVNSSVTITQPAALTASASINGSSVTISASGGTSPYSYSWSNGATGASQTGLGNGSYTVTVTDAHSCTSTVTVVIGARNITWQGTGTANWSTASNWSGNQLPSAIDTVSFNGSLSGTVNIDQNVTVAKILVSASSLTITQNSSTVSIGSGGLQFSAGTFTGSSGAITVQGPFSQNGGTFTSTSGTLSVSGNFTITSASVFNHNNGTLQLKNNSTISSSQGLNHLRISGANTLGSSLSLAGNLSIDSLYSLSAQNNTLSLAGSWANNGAFNAGSGKVIFTGANDQTLFCAASGGEVFNDLQLTKPLNNGAYKEAILNSRVSINGKVIFGTGNIKSDSVNIIVFKDNATADNVSDNSFINGPARKTGNDLFVFPLGKNNKYRPIKIYASNMNLSDEYSAEAFTGFPPHNTSIDSVLTSISNCEYWDLNKISGNGVFVTTSWGGCENIDTSLVAVVHLNHETNVWEEIGSDNITGDSLSGTVTSKFVSGFSNFASGTKRCGFLLPVISLYSTNATCPTDKGTLCWKITSPLAVTASSWIPSAGSGSPINGGTINSSGNVYSTSANPSVAPLGTYYLKVTIGNSCVIQTNTATFPLTVDILDVPNQPQVNISAPVNQAIFCSTQNVPLTGIITLPVPVPANCNGFTPCPGCSTTTAAATGLWTSSGSGTFLPNSAALNATYNFSAADINAGTVTLTLTATGSGKCSTPLIKKSVVINISKPPTASNAGPDQSVCGPTATLAGNIPSIGTGHWSLAGGGTGVVTTPSSPTSGVTGLVIGTPPAVFVWVISNAPCAPSTDVVMITRIPSPITINAGPDQTILLTSTATLSGTVTVATGGTWTSSGSGTFSPNALNAIYTPSAADKAAGSVILTITSTGNGECSPVTDQLRLTISPGDIYYSELKKELDGGFYNTVENKLYFRYQEKYADGLLKYQIYDFQRNEMIPLSLQTGDLALTKKVGGNFFSINIGDGSLGFTANSYYILEVSDEKGGKYMLRFKYKIVN